MEPTNQTPEPTPTQTQAPAEPTTAPPQEPVQPQEPAAPGTFAQPAQTQEPEPQQTAPQEPATQEPTEPAEPTEPTEPGPDARVVPKPSEYELPEGLPDNLRIFAHEHGFTQEQLNATIQQFGGYMNGMHQAESQAMRQMGEAHVKNWGNEAKTNLALAKAAMGWLDSQIEGFSEYINTTPAGNNPHVLQALYLVGRSMQEGGFLKSSVPRKPGDKTVAQSMYGDNHPSTG